MKKSAREKLNLFFSAFLVIGYIVCTYFFLTLTSRVSSGVASLINIIVFVLFGLVVFYATRVGEGEPVKRFSAIVLCVLVVPALLIILASTVQAFPLYEYLSTQPAVMMAACVALGYGIPYTFLSGFEMIEAPQEDEDEIVEGGIAQELAQAGEPEEEITEEAVATEEDVAELEAIDGAEEADDTADAE